MSKTQEAKDLLAFALEDGGLLQDRLKALETANDIRKGLSIGWAKLDAPAGFNLGATLEELREHIQAAEGDQEKPLDGETQPPEHGDGSSTEHLANAEQPKKDRGGIGRLVNLLLTTTDLDYATIVAQVKEQFPEAKTTARSVASVAADLRRDGVDVKTRRKPAAPKVAKADKAE